MKYLLLCFLLWIVVGSCRQPVASTAAACSNALTQSVRSGMHGKAVKRSGQAKPTISLLEWNEDMMTW